MNSSATSQLHAIALKYNAFRRMLMYLYATLRLTNLNNGMQLLHIPSFYQEIAKGFIIIGAVLMDRKKK